MLFLVPMAWISFSFLNLSSGITGGLIEDLEVALNGLIFSLSLPPFMQGLLSFLGSALIGLVLILFFPIHWCLTYRPNDISLIIAVIAPWILCCVITSAIFAHSPRGGIHTSLAIGIGYMIIALSIYFIIPLILNFFLPGLGVGGLVAGILDGLSIGLTDLPYALAVFTAILEGCLVGAVFGGFIGSLKYKPKSAVKKKKVKVKASPADDDEPTLEKSIDTDYCTHCGAKLTPGEEFCTNCGQKRNNVK
jgi:hypothetical protein